MGGSLRLGRVLILGRESSDWRRGVPEIRGGGIRLGGSIRFGGVLILGRGS